MSSPGVDVVDDWAFVGDVVAIVSPFESPNGIARYSDQLSAHLDSRREVLRVPLPWNEHPGVDVLSGTRSLRLLRRIPRSADVILMWHPSHFVSGRWHSRTWSYLALAAVARLRRVACVVHEPDLEPRPLSSRAGRPVRLTEEVVRRLLWGSMDSIVVHSSWEARRFQERFPRLSAGITLRVMTHGSNFEPSVRLAPEVAKRRLGRNPNVALVLCIGHLSATKGFERAVRSFGEVAEGRNADLVIVGAPVMATAEVDQTIAGLTQLVAMTPRTELRVGVVDDDEFDIWLQAADLVVAPYVAASSSSVVPRAQMFGTRVLASSVGALPEQMGPRDRCFQDDADLTASLADMVDETPLQRGR